MKQGTEEANDFETSAGEGVDGVTRTHTAEASRTQAEKSRQVLMQDEPFPAPCSDSYLGTSVGRVNIVGQSTQHFSSKPLVIQRQPMTANTPSKIRHWTRFWVGSTCNLGLPATKVVVMQSGSSSAKGLKQPCFGPHSRKNLEEVFSLTLVYVCVCL